MGRQSCQDGTRIFSSKVAVLKVTVLGSREGSLYAYDEGPLLPIEVYSISMLSKQDVWETGRSLGLSALQICPPTRYLAVI